MSRRRGLSERGLIGLLLIGAIAGMFAYRATRPLPSPALRATVPALRIDGDELGSVVDRLDSELHKTRVADLCRLKWDSPRLKQRGVRIATDRPLPLRDVLDRIGRDAGVRFVLDQECRECGGPTGAPVVVDARRFAATH